MSETRPAVVVAGGAVVPQFVPEAAQRAAVVIAADSGLDLAERLGLPVDLVVGDLDSVSGPALQRARDAGVRIEASPADKDETDLELALDAAQRSVAGPVDAARVIVLGGAGGRLDHLAAVLAALTSPARSALELVAYLGTTRLDVVRSMRPLHGAPGRSVSLLAWHGDATGVTTTGLRWPLDHAVLRAGSALGTSNEFTGPVATVSVGSGVVSALVDAVDGSIEPGEVV